MKAEESSFRESLASLDDQTSVQAALGLVDEFLLAREEFETSEMVLLEVLGKEGGAFSIHLKLGEIYLKMGEASRAKRFLQIASNSRDDVIRQKSNNLLEGLDKF